MEVGQDPNWGCSEKEKKKVQAPQNFDFTVNKKLCNLK
jgi:hypothetical protein